ncbi:MFS transporter [Lacibacterium aquatile]|uniref:MFS transporter n=1 Tax=Lacibacterium aquatile TaxID=1168082 RepID=A0ABW5DVV3_9PROT
MAAPIDKRTLAVALAGAAAFLDLYPTQALLPDLAAAFQAGPAEVAMTVTVGTAAVALMAPITGALADRFGRKRLIVGACLALVLPTLMTALSGSLAELLLWRFLQGLLLPAIFAVTVAYVGEEYEPGEISRASGLYIAGTIMGGFLGRFVAALVAEGYGWRWGLGSLAILNLACGLALWAYLPPARSFRPADSLGSVVGAMGRHLRRPPLVATFALGFGVLFSLVALFTYANFHLAAAPYSLSTGQLGAVFIVYLTGVAASPWTGRLIRLFGRRGALATAVGIACTGLVLTLFSPLPVIIAGLAVGCAGIFITQSAATGYVAGNAPEAKTAAVGLYVASYYLGGSLGAVVPAMALAQFDWPGVVVIVALVQAAMLLTAWIFWRDPK